MDKVKKELEKLSYVMEKVEKAAREEINSNEEFLQVCGAMLAVTRNMYIEALGPVDTSKIFQTVAESFGLQEEVLEIFRNVEKPTIH
jgi:Skp family chaperone for outer membrane proteins